MMKITDFINSRDVREYLESIEYDFSVTEAARFIKFCKNITLEDKHSAWKKLMESYSDVEVDVAEADYSGSLFAYLKGHMERENKLIERFLEKDAGAVYSYRFYCDGEWIDDGDVFGGFADCKKSFEDDNADFAPDFVEFTKKYLGQYGNRIYCRMTSDGKILKIEDNCIYEDFIFDDSLFYYMNVSAPTPFKKGDLIKTVGGKYGIRSYVGGTFVIASTSSADGDKEDFAEGYFIDENKNLRREPIFDLYDCEYLRDELDSEESFLVPVSNFVKGEIDACLLIAANKMALGENMANKGRSMFSESLGI